MKTIRQLFGAAAGVLMVSFGGFAHAEYSGYHFCEAEYRSYGDEDISEVYISGVFYDSYVTPSRVDDSFAEFIDAEYDPEATIYNVSCARNQHDSEREAERSRNRAISNWRDRDYEVHRVRWSR
ncbi:hypothetical protein F1529_02660 [Alcanivorax sp. VBW004]|uniref:hypothetical protein n=1 Tax=Alcanivorax sp. VBW004 TaxID=1287708 RepID=UPI0012BB86AA|nr:hypothetical protein [Alcanivorax sp. VBW004]MTT51377.1 hypothetical protein [Alcanivorax sp. VBW004]